MSGLANTMLVISVVIVLYAISYILCVGTAWVILFIITKMGFDIDLDIWWSGALLFLILLIIKK